MFSCYILVINDYCLLQCTSPENHFGDVILFHSSPILILLGTLGNLLSIIIFNQKEFRKKSTSNFLMILAFSDTMVLYCGLPRWWIRIYLEMDIRALSSVGCKVHIFLTYVFSQFSSYI